VGYMELECSTKGRLQPRMVSMFCQWQLDTAASLQIEGHKWGVAEVDHCIQ